MSESVITRSVAAGAGCFAPGHLGPLTWLLPFSVVDEVLARTGRVQRRVRDLPARVVVYLLVAQGLCGSVSLGAVYRMAGAALGGAGLPDPTRQGLHAARVRLGSRPLQLLLRELCRHPAAVPQPWRGLEVCAVDGTVLAVPDSAATRAWLGKHKHRYGTAGYPLVQVIALVYCSTRTLADAVFGPVSGREFVPARRLLRSLHTGMLVLLDAGFDAAGFLSDLVATGADFTVRLPRTARLPALQRYPDGSWLTLRAGREVRAIAVTVQVTTDQGTRTSTWLLATSLLNWRTHPADAIAACYHDRWEVEETFCSVKSTMLGGRVLHCTTPAGLAQEIHALLISYQLLRLVMARAGTAAGLPCTAMGFTLALRETVNGITTATEIDGPPDARLLGAVGTYLRDHPLPPRRLRIYNRLVKRSLSKYAAGKIGNGKKRQTVPTGTAHITATINHNSPNSHPHQPKRQT
ncbi:MULTISPECIES: IS4 family transposase [unclassified Streptomyces]|uniref:IS4 family transposase n=1 Tax=unclassified Streptomyces TaxID=2593676 RepID=UPI002E2A76CC|nr:IS4 family transposase [Streptomyces sp. NBC_00223]